MSPEYPPESPAHLVILGCGYVGTAVARAALARGWRVSALTRNPGTAERLGTAGVEVVVDDLASDGWHGSLDPGAPFVLDCVSSAGGGLPGYWHSYVDGMRSVARWAVSRAGGTFVYTGSTSVYPQTDGSVVDEDAPVGEGSAASEPLLAAERLVRETPSLRRAFVLRLAGIYGPGRHYLLDQLREGAAVFPGTGTHRLNLVHRDDIVRAVFACLDAPEGVEGGVFNVADGAPATKAEVAEWLARRLGRPPPEFAREADRSEAAGRARGRSGPVPDRVISPARIRRVVGWEPRYADFRAGYGQVFAAEAEA